MRRDRRQGRTSYRALELSELVWLPALRTPRPHSCRRATPRRYRDAGQCCGVQAGVKACAERVAGARAVSLGWTVLLLDVLLHDGQRCPAGGAREVRGRPKLVGSIVVGRKV